MFPIANPYLTPPYLIPLLPSINRDIKSNQVRVAGRCVSSAAKLRWRRVGCWWSACCTATTSTHPWPMNRYIIQSAKPSDNQPYIHAYLKTSSSPSSDINPSPSFSHPLSHYPFPFLWHQLSLSLTLRPVARLVGIAANSNQQVHRYSTLTHINTYNTITHTTHNNTH